MLARVSEGGRTDSAVGLRGDPGPLLCVPVFAVSPQSESLLTQRDESGGRADD